MDTKKQNDALIVQDALSNVDKAYKEEGHNSAVEWYNDLNQIEKALDPIMLTEISDKIINDLSNGRVKKLSSGNYEISADMNVTIKNIKYEELEIYMNKYKSIAITYAIQYYIKDKLSPYDIDIVGIELDGIEKLKNCYKPLDIGYYILACIVFPMGIDMLCESIRYSMIKKKETLPIKMRFVFKRKICAIGTPVINF